MSNPSGTGGGPSSSNLDLLIQAGILTQDSANQLTNQQRSNIEKLQPGQIFTMIDVFNATGAISIGDLI